MYKIVKIMNSIEIDMEITETKRQCRNILQMIRNEYMRKGWTSVKIGKDCVYVLSRSGNHHYRFAVRGK